jgi:site-specific DNA recombinase
MRVALYLRVSTVRQAEKDLSIPDQRKQAHAYCERRGWTIVREFEEPGASATDDRRPVFQEMLDAAQSPERPFNVILVHSYSRFARNLLQSELHQDRLERQGVMVVSITQETAAAPEGRMMRQMLGMFDEHQSRENAKHTLRGMKENARQGFWNGARPPFGYKVIDARTKRKRSWRLRRSRQRPSAKSSICTYTGNAACLSASRPLSRI